MNKQLNERKQKEWGAVLGWGKGRYEFYYIQMYTFFLLLDFPYLSLYGPKLLNEKLQK
jgi:hypothetical protein